MAPSPPQARPPEEAVQKPPQGPGPVPDEPAPLPSQGGEAPKEGLRRGPGAEGADLADEALPVLEAKAPAVKRPGPAGLHLPQGDPLQGELHRLAVGDGKDLGEKGPGPGGVRHQGVEDPLHQGQGEPVGDGGDEAHPEGGEPRGEDGDGEDDPLEPPHLGVGLHHGLEGEGFCPDLHHVGRPPLQGQDQVGQHVPDGDGRDGVQDPAGGHHDGQAFREVADHLKAGGPRADHGPRPELRGGEVRPQDLPHLGPAPQVGGGLALLGQEAPQVDHVPQPRLPAHPGEGLRLAALRLLEGLLREHGVDQVVGGLRPLQGPPEGPLVLQASPHHLHPPRPGAPREAGLVPHQDPHLVPSLQEAGNQPPPHVPRGPRDQDAHAPSIPAPSSGKGGGDHGPDPGLSRTPGLP